MKFRSFPLRFSAPVLTLALLACGAFAQRASGTITGRVITEDGQPIPRAVVSIVSAGGGIKRMMTGRKDVITDDEGNFVADGLDPVPYQMSAGAPGYVLASGNRSSGPSEPAEMPFTRIGEAVTLTMFRGGVITGRVTSATGEPVIGVTVKATRIQDEGGRPVASLGSGSQPEHTTDDRGIYRIYGLAPGSYIVAAGGSSVSEYRPTPFAGRAITYYPSSTRDVAVPVKVSSGMEALGIDISYRGERGFSISGRILGGSKTAASAIQLLTTVVLRNATTGEAVAMASFLGGSDQNGYALYGISNGEYEVLANTEGLDDENGEVSMPRRVSIKGNDVTGVDLTLTPNAVIAGTVAIEKAAAAAHQCEGRRESLAAEIIIKARRNEPDAPSEFLSPLSSGYGIAVPYDKGLFTIRNLKPGRHHIELELPDGSLYLKTMTLPGATPANDPRAGIKLKPGDKLTGLNLTIAPGAAAFKGKIIAADNVKLPSRIRVHLVPAEPNAKNDILRFAETRAAADGTFAFTNLAPGKYLVVVRGISNSERDDKPPQPSALDITERAKLQKEAEITNLVIELSSCQRITDYVLRAGR